MTNHAAKEARIREALMDFAIWLGDDAEDVAATTDAYLSGAVTVTPAPTRDCPTCGHATLSDGRCRWGAKTASSYCPADMSGIHAPDGAGICLNCDAPCPAQHRLPPATTDGDDHV